jgi:hypothetical protein
MAAACVSCLLYDHVITLGQEVCHLQIWQRNLLTLLKHSLRLKLSGRMCSSAACLTILMRGKNPHLSAQDPFLSQQICCRGYAGVSLTIYMLFFI